MRYIPSIVLYDYSTYRKVENYDGVTGKIGDPTFIPVHEQIVISFRHNHGNQFQSYLIMVCREYIENGQVTYAKMIWSTHHIWRGIRKFIIKQLPGLARICKFTQQKI